MKGLLEAVLLLVGGFLVVAIAIGAMGYQLPTNVQANGLPGSEKGSVIGRPTVSPTFIDHILSINNSPAAGTGQALYNLGVQYGIDPAYALAFFQHESGYGRFGVAATTRSLGNLRCFCSRVWQYFSSWVDGYRAWYSLISGPLYVKAGLTTVRQIIPKYAPAADHNNEAAYINAVESAVKGWRQAHG